ncbi:uncharacterized protein PAE49_004228 [Odontesthes bonariensis]
MRVYQARKRKLSTEEEEDNRTAWQQPATESDVSCSDKLSVLSVPDHTCRWITDFLTDRSQRVRLGKSVSATRTLKRYNVTSQKAHSGAPPTGLEGGDETAYRREVDWLVTWCSSNNLELNAQKTVEIVVDFRKSTAPLPPLALTDTPITTADCHRFLGTTITQDLKWEPTIRSLTKKAQQRMYFLRQLRKAKLPAQLMVQFYTAIIESILCSSITVWYPGASARDRHRLQRAVRSAEKVIGCSLPSIHDLHVSRTMGRAGRITADPSLFEPLPSGRRLRSIRTRTSCHKNSFFPLAVGLINAS